MSFSGGKREGGAELEGLELRGARVGDLPFLAALHAEAFSEEAWSGEALARLLAMPGVFSCLAFRQDRPLAFLLARFAAEEGEILTLAVTASARRQGIARALLLALEREAGRRQILRIFLEVATDNPFARALYRSMGFCQKGLRQGYYRRQTGRQDAQVMAKELVPPA